MTFRPRAPSALKVAGAAVAIAVAAGCGSAYYSFINHQRDYLVGRNFRLLANLGAQMEKLVDAEASVVANLASDRSGPCRDAVVTGLFDQWTTLHAGRFRPGDMTFHRSGCVSREAVFQRLEAPSDLRLAVFVRAPAAAGGDGRSTPATQDRYATLRLAPALDPIVESRRAQRAFETIVVAAGDGRIVYGNGPYTRELMAGGLQALIKTTAGAVTMQDLTRTMAMADVTVSGVPYKLFTQPCCSQPGGEEGYALVGLVPAAQLRAASLAISTALVKLVMLLLLLAILGWPFLKLILHGDRQELHIADVVQVLAASVAGLSIATITVLDTAAYTALRRDTDAELSHLAVSLNEHAVGELGLVYRQMRCVEEQADRLATWGDKPQAFSNLLGHRADCPEAEPGMSGGPATASGTRGWPYPIFETVAFIDAQGQQQLKFSPGLAPPPIKVATRDYFTRARDGLGWKDRRMCPQVPCVLESVWSWTTGEPLAVLAAPATRRQPWPTTVLALATPMRSLIRPVLPPGFEFVVIDRDGSVLFHSDRFRNTNENFFTETDGNRRLRAKVAAHSQEALSLRYFGDAYRAYVKPLDIPDLYVVALAQQSRLWAINRDWLVAALIFSLVPFVLWLIAALVTVVPSAPWCWPDPLRSNEYSRVAWFSVLLALGAVLAAGTSDASVKFVVALVLPPVCWIGSYILLVRRPVQKASDAESVATRPASRRRYMLAAVPILIVCGVVPGALMFLASYQLHTEAFVKSSQLRLVQGLQERDRRLVADRRSIGAGGAADVGRTGAAACVDALDVDIRFAYDTRMWRTLPAAAGTTTPRPSCAPGARASRSHGASHEGDLILALLEDYLPYYSESSVEWRELLHHGAADRTWTSERVDDGRLELESTAGGITVSTALPRMTRRLLMVDPEETVPATDAVSPTGAAPAGADATAASSPAEVGAPGRTTAWFWVSGILVAGAGLVGLACGIVAVFFRHVFLVDVAEPLWLRGPLAQSGGDNVFAICTSRPGAAELAQYHTLPLGPIAASRDMDASWTNARMTLEGRDPTGGAVLIPDFDAEPRNVPLMVRKLGLLEQLAADPLWTVVVVSTLTPRAVDIFRRAGASAGSPAGAVSGTAAPPLERWSVLVGAFTVRDGRPGRCRGDLGASAWPRSIRALLNREREFDPYVARVCDDLLKAANGRALGLTPRQLADEIAERTQRWYRRLWASCTDDEKVVLGHIAHHGFANARVRREVRRLLGRGLLRKDPALRPMSESFRQFLRSVECSTQVTRLEGQAGPSTWDRLRWPLALGVVGTGLFLFVTQKDLYNAIFGVTTAAGVSIPALIRAVGMLAGRREGESARA